MNAYFCEGGEADDGSFLVELIYAESPGKAKSLAMRGDGWYGWVEFTDVRARLVAKGMDFPAGRARYNDPLWDKTTWEVKLPDADSAEKEAERG